MTTDLSKYIKQSGKTIHEVDTVLLLGSQYHRKPLKNVVDEINDIEYLLKETDAKVICKPYLNKEIISQIFQDNLNKIDIIHFAGHSDENSIQSDEDKLYINKIAEIIGSWRTKPKLIFINGCNSSGQAETFISSGIDCVIATTSYISDSEAKYLATSFFGYLKKKILIHECLSMAYNSLMMSQEGSGFRSLDIDNYSDKVAWKIFPNPSSVKGTSSFAFSFKYMKLKLVKRVLMSLSFCLLLVFSFIFIKHVFFPQKIPDVNESVFEDKVSLGNLLNYVAELRNDYCKDKLSVLVESISTFTCGEINISPPLNSILACSKAPLVYENTPPLSILRSIEKEFGHCLFLNKVGEDISVDPILDNINMINNNGESVSFCKCVSY